MPQLGPGPVPPTTTPDPGPTAHASTRRGALNLRRARPGSAETDKVPRATTQDDPARPVHQCATGIRVLSDLIFAARRICRTLTTAGSTGGSRICGEAGPVMIL
jgi:hypothetical protein